MLKFYLFSILILSVFSSNGQLELTVKDSASGEKLPFVNVYSFSAKAKFSTNLDGKTSLNIHSESNDTLILSYIGYKRKVMVISPTSNESLTILLEPIHQNLEEVTVTNSKNSLTGIQIIKKVLKQIPRNYPNSSNDLFGIYRETMLEDEKAIYLNEASIKINYCRYPTPNSQRLNWEDWYDDDTYAFEFNWSLFDAFPNQFNGKNDKVELLEARSTLNWSENNFNGSIIGGPLSITSKDFVKYQSDFFDSKNLNQYTFKKSGIANIEGTQCYVVKFHPNKVHKKLKFAFGKKIRKSIYTGNIFIDKETFAVVKMEFQLSKNVNFGYYERFIPFDQKIEVHYKKQDNFYRLHRIKFGQLRLIQTRKKASIKYESFQELFILNCYNKSIPIEETSNWKHTRKTTLRDYETAYNEQFWDSITKTKFPKIDSTIYNQLNQSKPIKTQFKERFSSSQILPEPKATKKREELTNKFETLSDDYHWFSNKENDHAFYDYLVQENEYADNNVLNFRRIQKKEFTEIKNFYTPQKEQNHTFKKGDIQFDSDSTDDNVIFEYNTPTEKKVIFNTSKFIAKRPNCFIKKMKFSKSHIGLTYTINGGLTNQLVILKKGNQNTIIDSTENVYSFDFYNDSILFLGKENNSKRSDKLIQFNPYLHKSSTIHFEADSTFDVAVEESNNFFFYTVQSFSENEIYYLEKNKITSNFKLLIKRKNNVLNNIKEFNERLYNLTNNSASNNRILEFKDSAWTELVGEIKNVFIQDFLITENYIFLKAIKKSFPKLLYKKVNESKWKEANMPEDIFGFDFIKVSGDTLQINYSSPKTPHQKHWFNPESNVICKKQELSSVSRRNKNDLRFIKTDRLWAKSKDGTKIPITISKHISPKIKHKGLILKVYGSYANEPLGHDFSSEDILLMKNGFSVAHAHVRGSSIKGNKWYKNGKLLKKKNTFNDYLACANYLIKKKYTDKNHLIGYGNSAGGLVIGVAINEQPEIFKGAILDYAYLDVLNTMIDKNRPLTTDHFKEIGNPKIKLDYNYQKDYCPYQNIQKKEYPNLLFTAGSNDYQTPAWQIAKFVAKLREYRTSNNNIILFKTSFGSGHSGSTHEDDWIKDLSLKHAFIYHLIFN